MPTLYCILGAYTVAVVGLSLWGRRELALEWRDAQGADRLITAVSVVLGPIIMLGLVSAAVLFDVSDVSGRP